METSVKLDAYDVFKWLRKNTNKIIVDCRDNPQELSDDMVHGTTHEVERVIFLNQDDTILIMLKDKV